MPNDYKKTRFTEEVKRLQREVGNIEFDITRVTRDGQFQVNKIKSEYKTRISRLEEKKVGLKRQIMTKEKELKRHETSMRGSSPSYKSEAQVAKEKRLGGHSY